MSEMVDTRDVLRALEDVRLARIEKAMSDEASMIDIGIAAMAVHTVAAFRRRYSNECAALDQRDQDLYRALSARLLEIDDGEDLSLAKLAAIMIAEARK